MDARRKTGCAWNTGCILDNKPWKGRDGLFRLTVQGYRPSGGGVMAKGPGRNGSIASHNREAMPAACLHEHSPGSRLASAATCTGRVCPPHGTHTRSSPRQGETQGFRVVLESANLTVNISHPTPCIRHPGQTGFDP